MPRAMRSNLCNRYVCGGLTQLKSALHESRSTMAFVGAADSVHLRRVALIEAQSTTPIALVQRRELYGCSSGNTLKR